MTFSDPDVARYINENFVSAWYNRGPGFHNDDYNTEQWIFQSAMESYPTKNICTFFLAPDGRAFYYVAGYYSPELFTCFLRLAMEVRKRIFDEKMQEKPDGLDAARRIHETAVKSVSVSEKKIADALAEDQKSARGRKMGNRWKTVVADYAACRYRGIRHEHSMGCAHNLSAGFQYLTKLHDQWSRVTELPDLMDVQYAYLWGNPFTEEGPDTRPVGRDTVTTKTSTDETPTWTPVLRRRAPDRVDVFPLPGRMAGRLNLAGGALEIPLK